jgi:hypothetical protein
MLVLGSLSRKNKRLRIEQNLKRKQVANLFLHRGSGVQDLSCAKASGVQDLSCAKASGVQDLSCAALVQDKYCIPFDA